MAFQLVNFLSLTLASGLDDNSTEMVVLDADLPSLEEYNPAMELALTLVSDTDNEHEIVYVTAQAGSSLTILRGREGTPQRSWQQGTIAVASPTVAVLAALVQEGTAATTTYVPNSIIRGNTVQQALDNAGDLILGAGLEPATRQFPTDRIQGLLLGTTTATEPRPFLPEAFGRIVTDGLATGVLGGQVSITPTTAERSLVLVARITGVQDLTSVSVRLHADGANYRNYQVPNATFIDGEWAVLHIPPSAFTQVGSAASAVNYLQVRVQDDGTGAVTADFALAEVFARSTGNASILRQLQTIDDLNTLLRLPPLRLDIYAVIESAAIGTIFQAQHFAVLKEAGIQVIPTINTPLQLENAVQVAGRFQDMLQRLASVRAAAAGVLLPNGYYGTTAGQGLTVLRIAQQYFERVFYNAQITGFNGLETPWLIPSYRMTAGETFANVIKTPWYSLSLDLSDLTNARVLEVLGTNGANLRANYVAPPSPEIGIALEPIRALADAAMPRTGGQFLGSVSNAAGSLGIMTGVTRAANFAQFAIWEGELRSGANTINIQNLPQSTAEVQLLLLYTAGTLAFTQTINWLIGSGEKSTNIADTGLVFTAGQRYTAVIWNYGGTFYGSIG